MQTAVKDRYIVAQSRMMYFAFRFLTILSIVLMALESYNLTQNDPQLAEIIIILSILLGILYQMTAILIVEVVYQEYVAQIPIISHLARLAPDLSITQRYGYLSDIFKRQTVSIVGLTTAWIILGDTHRAGAIIFGMTLITAFAGFGMYHIRSLPLPTEDTDNLIDEKIS